MVNIAYKAVQSGDSMSGTLPVGYVTEYIEESLIPAGTDMAQYTAILPQDQFQVLLAQNDSLYQAFQSQELIQAAQDANAAGALRLAAMAVQSGQ
jgi:hypothetical protein